MVVVNHRLSTRLLQHLNPFNELLEFAINRFIKGHKGDGTPPGHQRNDEWMSFWKNRKHFIHFVEKLKNFEKNLEQNWFIWKQIYWKRVCYEPYFYSLFLFFAMDFVADSWEMHIEGAWLQTSSAMIFAKKSNDWLLAMKRSKSAKFSKMHFWKWNDPGRVW